MPTRTTSFGLEGRSAGRGRDDHARGPVGPLKMPLDYHGHSLRGGTRAVNEDHHRSCDLEWQSGIGPTVAPLLTVADGLGREPAGECASRIAVASVVDFLRDLRDLGDATDPEDVLRSAFVRAHLDLLEDEKLHPERTGMATTLTAVLVLWPRAYVLHLGDSRAYHLREGRLARLTTDHTVEQQLRDQSPVLSESIALGRFRHVVWNHLGGGRQFPHPELTTADLEPGDGLLLTTDGLTNVLPERDLEERIARWGSAEAVSRGLVGEVRKRGGRDDATALYARFGTAIGTPRDPSCP
jgi:serine/threonine protein phosphatase PrpC